MRAENASCQANLLNDPGRFGCRTAPGAAVIVYRPSAVGDTAMSQGTYFRFCGIAILDAGRTSLLCLQVAVLA